MTHTEKKTRRTRLGALVAAALCAVLAQAGGASASATAARTTGATKAAIQFEAQDLAAGLTPAQAATLQAKVDRYVAKSGGIQVAANEVKTPAGSIATFALPGQSVARSLSGGTGLLPYCPYYYVCMWTGPGGTGDEFKVSACNIYQEVPDSFNTTNGSYFNNQSQPGSYHTQATWFSKGPNPQPLYGAFSPTYDTGINWRPIWYVMACGYRG